jgi:prefoldin subunit 5
MDDTNIDLKSLLEQYNKTESLVDELANDLEQLERY